MSNKNKAEVLDARDRIAEGSAKPEGPKSPKSVKIREDLVQEIRNRLVTDQTGNQTFQQLSRETIRLRKLAADASQALEAGCTNLDRCFESLSENKNALDRLLVQAQDEGLLDREKAWQLNLDSGTFVETQRPATPPTP